MQAHEPKAVPAFFAFDDVGSYLTDVDMPPKWKSATIGQAQSAPAEDRCDVVHNRLRLRLQVWTSDDAFSPAQG